MVNSMYHLAVANHHCPKCKAAVGECCTRPSGRKTHPPHGERLRLLTKTEVKSCTFKAARFNILNGRIESGETS